VRLIELAELAPRLDHLSRSRGVSRLQRRDWHAAFILGEGLHSCAIWIQFEAAAFKAINWVITAQRKA